MEFHEQTSPRKNASGEDTTGQKTNSRQEARVLVQILLSVCFL
jgi:hypothetical protein